MYAIKIENIVKKFDTHYDNSLYPQGEVYALKNVTIEIGAGKVFGIIGRNGSGKTTLLNIIAGIMAPTKGNIKVQGRISTMLTLGAGFQFELSGRENIFLNGSLLGMSDGEIRKKFYEIVKFSELEAFLDKPLQSYSQGMKMRLGFSVATHIDFDILLIDEILSVGDFSFQNKSAKKIEEFRKSGKTMVVVSQSLGTIERLCDKVALLEQGELVTIGKPPEVIKEYKDILATKCFSEIYAQEQKNMIAEGIRWWGLKEDWGRRQGAREIELSDVKIFNSFGKESNNFRINDNLRVKLNFIIHHKVYDPHFGVAIFREDGVYCYGPNTRFDGYRFEELKRGDGALSINYDHLKLMPGEYRLSVGIWDKKEKRPFDYLPGFYKFKISGNNHDGSLLNLNYRWKLKNTFADTLSNLIFVNNVPTAKPNFKPKLDFNQAWGKTTCQGNIKIKRIDFLDRKSLIRETFSHGELMHILAELEYAEPADKACFIWFGIFREDKVYCHGATKKLSANETKVSLVYPSLQLLNGRYYISVGICAEDGSLLYCHHGVFGFEVYSHKKDHGTVYIDHKWRWKFNGQR